MLTKSEWLGRVVKNWVTLDGALVLVDASLGSQVDLHLMKGKLSTPSEVLEESGVASLGPIICR